MSGTSLDGLDLALCEFSGNYEFKMLKAKTVSYSQEWKSLLSRAQHLSAEEYFELHAKYGKFIAEEINLFLQDTPEKPAAIASHGHTVFHQPQLGFSTQIGCGATIAANTGITTVCDFRSLDVAMGGQGAPLVPVGDKLLFGHYAACLNIGGIANISFDENGKRIAYDICEANMLLNFLAEKNGKSFDENGDMARAGKIDSDLLNELNGFSFYTESGAKSLGREWFEKNIMSLIEKSNLNTNDLLATSTEHIARIIANEFEKQNIKNVLITGGGAFNTYLIEKIKSKTTTEIILPEAEIINFKEALIFAFLGYLRLIEKTNTLSSVTGAKQDSVGGAVYFV